MLDFFMIAERHPKSGVTEVYPKFIVKNSKDLMIRGGDFYAVWIEDRKLWSTDEEDVIHLIDRELDDYVKKNKERLEGSVKVLHMWDGDTGMIDKWHKYCTKQLRDRYTMLDEKLIFSNDDVVKEDYASKRLPYPLEEGPCPAFDKLIGTLYSEEERKKIEWAIGSIVSGDSKKIQKFMVLYGAAGTGKSTILNIIQQLFDGYYSVFDAKSLGSSSNAFALESFKTNPLVAIQHDGDLSKIEDNTRLNSLVSHELMTVNEKFKGLYSNNFKCFLFMGTNKPVRITDGKSGLIRRLIDVTPSGNKLSAKEYRETVGKIKFELGQIAHHCREVYLNDPNAYDDYIPVGMMGASNDFYNFVIDSFHVFKKDDGTTLKAAWEMYKTYCDEARVPYPFSQRNFKEELKNYFWDFKERFVAEDGARIRSFYSGFRTDKFEEHAPKAEAPVNTGYKIDFGEYESIFDTEFAECLSQYGSSTGTPQKAWDAVTTRLKDIDTKRLHYVCVPVWQIVIDFDLKDENGKKSFEKNLEAASKWPPTYAELSKSGAGIHLHYYYSGDPTKLLNKYADDIEIKVFTGKSSLRRQLTKCNNLPIATLSSGLPLKGEKKMVDIDVIKSERQLRSMIKRNLNKEFLPGTKPSMDFIKKLTDDAYNSKLHYDISDMKNAIIAFAAGSTHQSDYCMKLIKKIHFKSEESADPKGYEDEPIVFFDVEVFPNLFLVNWKIAGEGHPVVRMINPKPADIEDLIKMKLVGFNCRKYDNHMLYGCLIGYTNAQLFELSMKIINEKKGFFGEAYNISYTDIYDFSSKKQSLKKFEIDLGIHHQELGLPWDQPVPEELWYKVAEYCDNDVIATEAVFYSKDRQADFTARKILADVAGMTVNDTTNSLTTRIIFGRERNPQSQFNYRFMGTEDDLPWEEYTMFDEQNRPVFPGYKYEFGVSTYRGEEVGEGGYVFSTPGMYGNVALLDIASMHPSSIVAERLFGEYTSRFEDILNARIAIKHKDFDKARTMLNGALAKYLEDEAVAADLAQALKIAINSVYGLTSATFDNPFHDIRNKDNIVAKRGALFMINLKHEVQSRGYVVAHIKTDSIKIPDADLNIIGFVTEYGKKYGYNFEHEATYDRMCLVNDAVYIAKYATVKHCCELYGEEYVNSIKDICKENKKHPGSWTATGTQFQIPYVFKTLFSKEPIVFSDICETKSVSTALYLDMNENLGEGEHVYQFVGKVGLFCPMIPGAGGGELLRDGKDKQGNQKFSNATGAKGYRWMEAEMVENLKLHDKVDRSYYDNLVNDAIVDISAYGDFEWFVSEDPYIPAYPYNTAADPSAEIFDRR